MWVNDIHGKFRVIFCDRNIELVNAWKEVIPRFESDWFNIEVVHGEIFQESTKAHSVVSPANSFGFMDGGIDLVYTKRWGTKVMEDIQNKIENVHGGELLVGQATAVFTNDLDYPACISAPTMRVPRIIDDPIDVYLATRAATRSAVLLGESVLFPGMGTGVGAVPPHLAALMMVKGVYEHFHPLPFPKSLGEAVGRHRNSVTESIRNIIGRCKIC